MSATHRRRAAAAAAANAPIASPSTATHAPMPSHLNTPQAEEDAAAQRVAAQHHLRGGGAGQARLMSMVENAAAQADAYEGELAQALALSIMPMEQLQAAAREACAVSAAMGEEPPLGEEDGAWAWLGVTRLCCVDPAASTKPPGNPPALATATPSSLCCSAGPGAARLVQAQFLPVGQRPALRRLRLLGDRGRRHRGPLPRGGRAQGGAHRAVPLPPGKPMKRLCAEASLLV